MLLFINKPGTGYEQRNRGTDEQMNRGTDEQRNR